MTECSNMLYKAAILDLDGVIVSTDECHYHSWKAAADKHNLTFDRSVNRYLKGVSRMESARILVECAGESWAEDRLRQLADEKNDDYVRKISRLSKSDILPGAEKMIGELRRRGLKLAIGSSSKNARLILDRLGLSSCFDAIVDGTMISQTKPSPEVFLVAAELLEVEPADCIVFEDAKSGVEAARTAGMAVAAVGELADIGMGDLNFSTLEGVDVQELLGGAGNR